MWDNSRTTAGRAANESVDATARRPGGSIRAQKDSQGMKVALISPERPFSGKVPMAPPILEYLGALTLRERPDAELRLIDGDFETFDPDDIDADIVGISAMTATAPWAYRIADRLRARGVSSRPRGHSSFGVARRGGAARRRGRDRRGGKRVGQRSR